MKNLSINIQIHPNLYLKNPEGTDLGRRIVSKSIEMIENLGFESFTFRKLGKEIGSNESSIYRYFDSKHALLVYLFNWYWSWIEYRMYIATLNLNPEEKLRRAIEMLTQVIEEDSAFSFVNEVLLHRIIIAESSKAYLHKDIDEENEKGFYKTYKRVVKRVSEMVTEVNPEYKYPNMLVSSVIEGAHNQRYFAEHLPSVTDSIDGEDAILNFYLDMVFNLISKKN
ncbi:TetR family transcriptional regulator [Nonlabens sp. MIC269]|nr:MULTISPECIES: TetR/AcrR family transcriptional regulator [Nonlabens]ALM20641.1 TetR family transcriptional regulator [Nonlabens sp. MIC269]ARN70305.1 TetR family transcriptional regulator [Nonlabens tegetincola]MEE2800927.1 TetR/AcrR family transcriptional regulator [Bacteroidota bacterium]PQJ19167.1 TetR family transcriptional regulator [Nonlabens tegetincola]